MCLMCLILGLCSGLVARLVIVLLWLSYHCCEQRTSQNFLASELNKTDVHCLAAACPHVWDPHGLSFNNSLGCWAVSLGTILEAEAPNSSKFIDQGLLIRG